MTLTRSLLAAGIGLLFAMPPAAAVELNLVPWPKQVMVGDATLEVTRGSRIVATDASLEPLAQVLADELRLALGLELATARDQPRDGDIVLRLDPALEGEAHSVTVERNATVRGGNYAAVALGTVTLSQAIRQQDGKTVVPGIRVTDAPDYRMRAVQMCIKHQVHQISKLKQAVDLCRQFKLNTLALHMSNYQHLWMLCPAFRENPLPKGNWDGGATYSLEEMKDLVEYARRRGVVILPEWGPADFAVPGHGMQWFYKALEFGDYERFDPAAETLLGNDRFWKAIDDLTAREAEVFSTSEYIHVGALDGETGHWNTAPDREFAKANDLRGSGEVWAWLLKRLCEINAKHGRKTMVFEGVRRAAAAHVQVPKEVCFFAYQTFYYPSDQMLADGYRVLNAAWRPLYTSGRYTARELYHWSPRIVRHNGDASINIELPKSDLFIGALLSTWEGGELGHLEVLTDRGAAVGERCWNEGAGRSWDDFSRRLAPILERLEAIQFPMGVSVAGALPDNRLYGLDRRWELATEVYPDKVVIDFKPRVPGLKIYYTAVDPYFIWTPDRPSPTNPKAKLVEGPVTITKDVLFRAQAFDEAGRPFGGEYCKIFDHVPIQITAEGLSESIDDRGRVGPFAFHDKAVVTFSAPGGGAIRYRTTPPKPGTPDKEYTGPITIARSTEFWVGIGKEGYQLHTKVVNDGYTGNILTMDRVKFETDAERQAGDIEAICDGYAENPDAHWNGVGACHLTIEMAVPRKIDTLEVVPWWGDGRAYRYGVEASADGKAWKQIVDMSQNATGSSPEGYSHRFDPVKARFLRFSMQGNTRNDHGHLVEVRAFDTTAAPK